MKITNKAINVILAIVAAGLLVVCMASVMAGMK